MTEWIVAALVFFIAMLAMAIGALAGREPIRGSCGGLGNCSACKRQCSKEAEESS